MCAAIFVLADPPQPPPPPPAGWVLRNGSLKLLVLIFNCFASFMARSAAAWPWTRARLDHTGRPPSVPIHILVSRPHNSVLRTEAGLFHHSNSTLNLTGTFPPEMCYFRHIVSKHECLLFCAYVLTGISSFSKRLAWSGQFHMLKLCCCCNSEALHNHTR